ncbi:hypothetical protein [Massilia endophytica]|uniref:hypothetical protein n=1 Tax=Massilia endophytica TaxID=2899220 RepID=UPI001E64C385|nr:hypothetical protein [Massilia endophytica]UGQ47358.1 hypothetical protein LSQ66_02435 [Massilia endophytica]
MKNMYKLGMLAAAVVLAACGGSSGGGDVQLGGGTVVNPPAPGPAWLNHGRDAQHTAQGGNVPAQSLSRLVWRADVDLQPERRDNFLASGHYGSPLITGRNTVLMPVKVAAEGKFRIEARDGATGALKWQSDTDYVPLAKTYSYNIGATPAGRVYFPGSGGKLYYRDGVDDTPGAVQTIVFYGADVYAANKAALDASLVINTPITTDKDGNVYFGYASSSESGGLVRIDSAGRAIWITAAAATGDAQVTKVANSAAPALSPDGKTVYAVMSSFVSNGSRGAAYMVALDSTTLTVRNKIQLRDPATGANAVIGASSTATPMVAPDGDVYFGVLGGVSIGWLLHYNADLTQSKIPGGFGWDMTPSLVPASAVGGYTGSSSYLLAVKYNSYEDGQHRMAVLDPNATQPHRFDPAVTVMKEVITVLSPTKEDPSGPTLHEWCINTGAFDPNTKSLFINNSDGYLYRWDLSSNKLSERFNLNTGYYQSYTPTALGPDGKVYAINNAVLMVVGK